MEKMEIRLTGSGGRGVILATIILAEAAILSGKMSAQSQSYGPEARGGMCKAEVIISERNIWYPKVTNPTLLLALTQGSFNQYSKYVPDNCIIIADSELTVTDAEMKKNNIIRLPILKTAKETVGKAFTANIVAVAAINEILKIVSMEQLYEAVLMHIPKGTEEINKKALLAGAEIAKNKY